MSHKGMTSKWKRKSRKSNKWRHPSFTLLVTRSSCLWTQLSLKQVAQKTKSDPKQKQDGMYRLLMYLRTSHQQIEKWNRFPWRHQCSRRAVTKVLMRWKVEHRTYWSWMIGEMSQSQAFPVAKAATAWSVDPVVRPRAGRSWYSLRAQRSQ